MPSPLEIKLARTQAGLTQSQAGQLLGVTRQAWARYEIGLRALDALQWQAWCHRAGLSKMPFKSRLMLK